MIKFWFRFYEVLFVYETKNVEFNNNTSKSYQNIAMRATSVDTEWQYLTVLKLSFYKPLYFSYASKSMH